MWADNYIKKLNDGETIVFCPRGNSMSGMINDGQTVHVSPYKQEELKVGDIVLCQVKGSQYLHLIKSIKTYNEKLSFLIGNNHGKENGWTTKIFGKVIKVEK